jgi:hypothetical protein
LRSFTVVVVLVRVCAQVQVDFYNLAGGALFLRNNAHFTYKFAQQGRNAYTHVEVDTTLLCSGLCGQIDINGTP